MSTENENNQLQSTAINFENLPKLVPNDNTPAEFLVGFNDVEDLLKGFSQYLAISKRVTSDNTKNTYLANVRQFLIWCNKLKFAIKNITKTLVLRNLVICFEKSLTSTDLAQNSRAIKHASVKKFFEWYSFLHEDYNIDLNKCFSPDWCTTADANAYKKQTRINMDVFLAIKEQADLGDINDKWIFFLLAFGCRRSEIAGAKVENVDFLNKEINVYQEKTGNLKKLPLPNWLTSADMLDRNNVYLVLNTSKRTAKSKGKKPVSKQYIWLKVRRWIAETKFKSVEITPHSFRRFFVNNLLRQGASDSNIAKIGGWANLNMVQRYGYDISLDNNPIINNSQVKY